MRELGAKGKNQLFPLELEILCKQCIETLQESLWHTLALSENHRYDRSGALFFPQTHVNDPPILLKHALIFPFSYRITCVCIKITLSTHFLSLES